MKLHNINDILRALALAGSSILVSLAIAGAARAETPPSAWTAPAPKMLPDRLLTCSIGHVTNFDPRKEQTPEQLKFDAMHEFNVFLPAIPVFTGIPPDAAQEAPPVDPRTRILADPDHISGQPSQQFGRIIDLWPERVEMSSIIEGSLLNLIVINPIDLDHGTASLFMLRAIDLEHYQADHIYQGTCHFLVGEAARSAVNAKG